MEWTSKTFKATNNTIDLKGETRPIRQRYYCAGQRSYEVFCEHMDKQLEAGVVKTDQPEWASPSVIVPKKDCALRICFKLPVPECPPYQTPIRWHVRMIVMTV